MNDFRRQKDIYDPHMIEDEGFHTTGYPDRLNVEFAYVDGEIRNTEGVQADSLFPMFDYEKGGADFLFMPLHFRNQTVGCFVIRNAVYLMEKQFLFQIVNTLTSAMENLHKKETLEYMNQMLSELYVRDTMTGMYNRLGYQTYACRLFDQKKRERENLLILFVDMDRLKYINDNYGHEHGDFAIKTISGAILHHCPKGAVPVRTGGDEFLVVLRLIGQAQAELLVREIRSEIADVAEREKLPYPLTISVGIVCTDMDTDRTLDDYIREADEIMYAEKVAKKADRRD